MDKGSGPVEIVLASNSPRRQELLRQIGVSFQVVPSQVDEVLTDAVPPAKLAETLALAKAREVAGRCPGALVLGADTVVVVAGEVLGKPADAADAMRMLRLLAGREHQVITGVALIQGAREEISSEVTTVHFQTVSDETLARYVATGEPVDKAGAYAIQGMAAVMIRGIEGDYFNVVGLPLSRVVQMLSQFGVQVL